MTLTTDELRQIAETDHVQCGDAAAMAREPLANREAQPVVEECNREVYENGKSACLVAIPKETAEVICRGISEATGCKVDWHYICGRVHIKALSPPAHAPAVAWEIRYWNSGHNCWHDWERITAEQHAEISVQHAADNDYEFRVLYDATPSPAVVKLPTELHSDEGIMVRLEQVMAALALVGVKYERRGDACRAAMLDQPVSQRYKLPDSVLVLLNHIEDVLDDENWNRISVKKWNAVTMLAAAPEGGNGA